MTTRSKNSPSSDDTIFRIPPYFYLHVLDQNTNVTRVEVGPKTYIRQDNERIILGPEKMVIVPPSHFCIVENPVQKDAENKIVYDDFGQAKLKHADQDLRLEQDPFPLYPGEVLFKPVTRLTIVQKNSALRLRATRDFDEDEKTKRVAGDEWLFEGPGTYIPRKEVEVTATLQATIIKPNQALRLRARMETTDRDGKKRVPGEEWLVKKTGAYLPGAYEEVVDVVDPFQLTDKMAIHVKAKQNFNDDNGTARKSGEEWLIKYTDVALYLPSVYVDVIGFVEITTLSNRQYCVICNPVGADGKNHLGHRKLVRGEKSFFLLPGEELENGIQDVYVLGENDGIVLLAEEAFEDDMEKPPVARRPGDLWLIRGPMEYVPPLQVKVKASRSAIPLDETEGIYVRDTKTGKVRAVCGQTYMLTQDEELWKKELPPIIEGLIESGIDPMADRGTRFSKSSEGGSGSKRDKTKVIIFRVPHNAAVQIYDYKEKKARVVFGPELVLLGPDEQFTQLSLSGGKPKKPNVIKALCLLLGPDFCTDIIVVETADHARLQLQVAYNWHFDLGKKTQEEASKLFSVPDFIGDACKAIASRIRGAVAGIAFDNFHKNSAKIIRTAVFGTEGAGDAQKARKSYTFPQNNLVITSIDIQSVEPVDQRTRDSLQKSVQLAIEITTNSQEATARHEAQRVEQEARGRLERQKITDEAEAEKSRRDLLELQAQSVVVESKGQATAEAIARAEAAKIEGEASVKHAELKSEALKIEAAAELERLVKAREAELSYTREQNELEIAKAKELASIESGKFTNMVSVLGTTTIAAIATSGPEMQVKLLQSLGLQSTLITDGKTPINLFNTAHGLLGMPQITSGTPGTPSRREQDPSTTDDD